MYPSLVKRLNVCVCVIVAQIFRFAIIYVTRRQPNISKRHAFSIRYRKWSVLITMGFAANTMKNATSTCSTSDKSEQAFSSAEKIRGRLNDHSLECMQFCELFSSLLLRNLNHNEWFRKGLLYLSLYIFFYYFHFLTF